MEWAMRFMQEPSRLGPRYFRDFTGLARRLPMTLLAAWLQRPSSEPSHLTTVNTPQGMHVYLHGRLGEHTCAEFQQASEASIASGLVMIVHMQGVKQITAAGLGVLMDVRRQLLDAGLTLSLAGLSFKHRFLLHAWCVQPLFDEWQSTIAHGRAMAPETEIASSIPMHGEQEALPAQTRIRG
jgi:anti-anti-sigma regulatory factor